MRGEFGVSVGAAFGGFNESVLETHTVSFGEVDSGLVAGDGYALDRGLGEAEHGGDKGELHDGVLDRAFFVQVGMKRRSPLLKSCRLL